MLNRNITANAFKIGQESKRIEDRLEHHSVGAVSKNIDDMWMTPLSSCLT